MFLMLDASNPDVNHIKPFFFDNVRMALQDRINELFSENPKTKNVDLANFVGCTRATITEWRKGKTQNISGENAFAVARFFHVNPEWVQNGKGQKHTLSVDATIPPLKSEINIDPGPKVYGKVPLISWVQAGYASEVVDLLHPGDGFEWFDTTCQVRRHTYALRIKGDSMSPVFPDGSVIIVEPEMDPLPGDYVIAKNGDDEATFKQLIKDGADYYLKPLNERYPIKPLGDYHVIGVVRQLIHQFR